jgi:hypothetical protein
MGAGKRHGREFSCSDPRKRHIPDVEFTVRSKRYGSVVVRAWKGLHQKLTRTGRWAGHPQDQRLPIVAGTASITGSKGRTRPGAPAGISPRSCPVGSAASSPRRIWDCHGRAAGPMTASGWRWTTTRSTPCYRSGEPSWNDGVSSSPPPTRRQPPCFRSATSARSPDALTPHGSAGPSADAAEQDTNLTRHH